MEVPNLNLIALTNIDRVSMASLFIVGVVTAWAGFNYPMSYYGITIIDLKSYQVTKAILSVALIAMALNLVRSHHMNIGILAILTGISTCSFSVTNLIFHAEGDYLMDTFFAFPVMFISVMCITKGQRFMATAIGILSVSMLLTSLFVDSTISLIGGVGLIISGSMLIILGLAGLIRNTRTEVERGRDYVYEMMSIAGFLFIVLYSLISTFETYGTTYYVVSLLLSFVITAVSVMVLMDGILMEGIVQFMYGVSGLLFSIGRLSGGIGYVITDMGIAMVIGVCGLMFFFRRQYTLAIPCTLFSILILPGFFFEQGVSWGFASMTMAPFLLYYSVSRWLYRDTGRQILPITE